MKNRRLFSARWPGFSYLIYRLRHYHMENPGLKLLSLLLALLFFAISRQPTSEITLVSVPLEIRGLRQGLEISSDIPQTVSVRLQGPQNILREVTASQISVVADLSTKEPGERVVQINPSDVTPLDNVRVLRVDPASIRLLIEPVAYKTVPVEPHFTGKPPTGVEMRSFKVEPTTIAITGPVSHVDKFSRALTESIPLDNRKENFTSVVDLDFNDRFVRLVSTTSIKVSVEIAPSRQP